MNASPFLRGRGTLWMAGAGAVAASAAAALLFRFDPMRVGFYPRCPLFVLTGLYCPGCGALRAGHALLHGDVMAALDFNVVLTVALPFLAYALVRSGTRATTGRILPAPRLSGRGAWGLFAVLMLFTVLRNLPFAPFTLLAP